MKLICLSSDERIFELDDYRRLWLEMLLGSIPEQEIFEDQSDWHHIFEDGLLIYPLECDKIRNVLLKYVDSNSIFEHPDVFEYLYPLLNKDINKSTNIRAIPISIASIRFVHEFCDFLMWCYIKQFGSLSGMMSTGTSIL